jgi:ribosomal silencing factor RsfS
MYLFCFNVEEGGNMAQLFLICDACSKKHIQEIPNDVLDDFGPEGEERTKKIKEWLKDEGIVCDCGEEFVILEVRK